MFCCETDWILSWLPGDCPRHLFRQLERDVCITQCVPMESQWQEFHVLNTACSTGNQDLAVSVCNHQVWDHSNCGNAKQSAHELISYTLHHLAEAFDGLSSMWTQLWEENRGLITQMVHHFWCLVYLHRFKTDTPPLMNILNLFLETLPQKSLHSFPHSEFSKRELFFSNKKPFFFLTFAL